MRNEHMLKTSAYEAHEFAFFEPSLPEIVHGCVSITDKALVHRLGSVVSLKEGDSVLLFDKEKWLRVSISAVHKRAIEGSVVGQREHARLTPTVHWVVPLLEKAAFEDVVSHLTVLGAASIQPVRTQKIHRNWWSEAHVGRMERIIISAAEQSKQFIFPVLHSPIEWDQLSFFVQKTQPQAALFFDPKGAPCSAVIPDLVSKQGTVLCMVGPEGDLTRQEKEELKKNGFIFCALTPSILRGCDAVFLGMGILRSFL